MKEKDIIKLLFHYTISDRGHKYCSSNTQAIFGVGEADFVSITRSEMLSEFEVKVSRSDFKADFRNKPLKHLAMANGNSDVNYFYFVCPEGLVRPEEVPKYAGLLYVCEWPNGGHYIVSVKRAKRIHSNKVNPKIIGRMLISLMHKYYRTL